MQSQKYTKRASPMCHKDGTLIVEYLSSAFPKYLNLIVINERGSPIVSKPVFNIKSSN